MAEAVKAVKEKLRRLRKSLRQKVSKFLTKDEKLSTDTDSWLYGLSVLSTSS